MSFSVTDMVAVPDFSAGAMENWGLILYRETALLYDPAENSAANKQRVAVVVSHELAHQVIYILLYRVLNLYIRSSYFILNNPEGRFILYVSSLCIKCATTNFLSQGFFPRYIYVT